MSYQSKKDSSERKKKKRSSSDLEEEVVSPDRAERWSDENKKVEKKEKKEKKSKKSKHEEKSSSSSSSSPSSSSSSSGKKEGIFSGQYFNELPITPTTLSAVKSLGFTQMTEIQAKGIPESLAGKDIVGAARTGSGKTLAFLIPIIELLVKANFTRKQGTGAIIISPTRELALQIYGVLRDIMENAKYPQTHGLIMGGANRKSEADKLIKGVNIIVATPGRLLDHLANTKGFTYSRLAMLVIDEADRILEQGFEDDLRQIIKLLPSDRQTLLYSATQTRKVEDLARLSLRENPVHVGVHDDRATATAEGLQQGYVVCPSSQRFQLLFTFLKKNRDKKIMVSYLYTYYVYYYILYIIYYYNYRRIARLMLQAMRREAVVQQ